MLQALSASLTGHFWPRAIRRGLAKVPIPSGEPDMKGIVGLIARAVPVATLPERSVNALGHTVQLLFDAGPAMLPFTRDSSSWHRRPSA